jgi:hypothetical protein
MGNRGDNLVMLAHCPVQRSSKVISSIFCPLWSADPRHVGFESQTLCLFSCNHLKEQCKNFVIALLFYSGLGSSVGIVTDYGLDGPGIESRWGRDFSHLSRPALGPTQPPVQWVPCLSWGYRAAGAWRWSFTPFSYCGQERIVLYLYSLYGPYSLYRASVSVQGCTLLTFTFYRYCFIRRCFYDSVQGNFPITWPSVA